MATITLPRATAGTRNRVIPGGRAAVGGLMVTLSVLGTYSAHRAATAPPTTRYLVAAHDLAPGHVIVAADLRFVALDLPGALGRSAAFTDPSRVIGSATIGPVGAGELVQASALTSADELTGHRLSFPLEAAFALDGTLRPGDRVDVIATFGQGFDSVTQVIAHQAMVVDTSGNDAVLGRSEQRVVTLDLSTRREAVTLAHAIRVGKVSLMRAAPTSGSGDDELVTGDLGGAEQTAPRGSTVEGAG
ncbi:MAG TPA: RcpC/CpaB family pilus assembly protein [Acidimicrobiales bacterium]|nr:RcpC/CpaB family pilus assembly protein [Acidimicrobiales bacterium]